ncbi:MAG: sugar ABC transporter permease YjfF [Clostridiales Family XIII bacterium]|jgi:simple sugar transport system permease protein|nr:sugar ABC transporter permease YjfF [Clostridiales Family XIII bacterium]
MTKLKENRVPLSNANLLFIIAAVILLVMYLFAIALFPESFTQPQTFFDLFNNNAALIILACGMSVVMIGGGIDISVGGVCGLVTMSCAVFLQSAGADVGRSVLLALAIGLAFGALQGFLIAYLEIQPFIITLAGMFLANGVMTIVNSTPIRVELPAFVALFETKLKIAWLGTVNRHGMFIPCKISISMLIAVGVIVAVALLLKWSRFGRNLYAVGGNAQSALMLGINVKRTRFLSYLLCGLLSGIAGYAFLLTTAAGNVGNASGFEMKAIAASIIGGTMLTGGVGNILGSPIGALSLLTINEIIRAAGIDSNIQTIISGFLLCFFIVLQSVIIWLRDRSGGFKLQRPPWLKASLRTRDGEAP